MSNMSHFIRYHYQSFCQ